jgi:hypothetical protein
MSDKSRERQGHGDEPSPENADRSEEAYESPKIEDIPVDQPAVTVPGAPSDGSPDLL